MDIASEREKKSVIELLSAELTEQFVRSEPIWFGIDANTPEIDHPDFESTRTHWHTGDRSLKGEPGDDLLVASTSVHVLNDALRLRLSKNKVDMEQIKREFPDGPLVVSLKTGKHLPGD